MHECLKDWLSKEKNTLKYQRHYSFLDYFRNSWKFEANEVFIGIFCREMTNQSGSKLTRQPLEGKNQNGTFMFIDKKSNAEN